MSAGLSAFINGFADAKKAQKAEKERDEERALRREEIERADAPRAGGRSLPDMPAAGGEPLAYGEDAYGPVGSSADLIASFEGFRETPYWDVNAHRVGFGSDTITMADGTVQKVTPGTKVSRETALLDLNRRIESEFRPSVINAIGEDAYAKLNPSQRAVLDSLAYNYGAGAWGKGLAPVRQAIREGGDVAGAIASLGSHNDGINRKRRAREAAIFSGGSYRPPTEQPAPRRVATPATATPAAPTPVQPIAEPAQVASAQPAARSFSITPGAAAPWTTFARNTGYRTS